jgi:hypothetical protein
VPRPPRAGSSGSAAGQAARRLGGRAACEHGELLRGEAGGHPHERELGLGGGEVLLLLQHVDGRGLAAGEAQLHQLQHVAVGLHLRLQRLQAGAGQRVVEPGGGGAVASARASVARSARLAARSPRLAW